MLFLGTALFSYKGLQVEQVGKNCVFWLEIKIAL